jgi:hypothetical protein
MTQRSFGHPNPLEDARRVLTAQSTGGESGAAPSNLEGPGIDLVGPQIGLGGDAILIYRASGIPVIEYPATEAGLLDSCAAAAAGDVIWLPAIDITLTSGLTIPIDVGLIAVGRQCRLSFSGFSGVAITCGANSTVMGFSIDFTATGTTAIGIDARAEGVVVDRMIVEVDGGTTLNIAVDTGTSIIVHEATEAWVGVGSYSVDLEDVIAWSTDYASGSPHWHKVASIPDEADPIGWMGLARDGSCLYVAFGNAPFFSKLYKCHNPKSASPAWECIMADGLAANGHTITSYWFYVCGPFVIRDNILHTAAHVAGGVPWMYCEYNGDEFTWLAERTDNAFAPDMVGPQTWCFLNLATATPAGFLEEFTSAYDGVGYEIYRANGGTRYCTFKHGYPESHAFIHALAGGDLQDMGVSVSSSDLATTKISGAEEGPHVYAVSFDGHLWRSANGSAFTDRGAWKKGIVRDHLREGGGNLVWISSEAIAPGNTIGKISLDDGVTWPLDLTGDWWTAVQSVKSFASIGLTLVFA